MDILPVVDVLERLALVVDDAVPEMDGKLANKTESRRVPKVLINTPKLGGRVLHEIDALDCVGVGEATPLHEALVRRLEDHLPNCLVADNHQPAHNQECCYPGGIGA